MTPPLRILVVLPLYGGSLPIGRYCARALSGMGHAVRIFDAPAFYSAFTGLKTLQLPPSSLAPLENAFLQVLNQGILAQVESFEPSLVLALAQAPLNRFSLQKLRKAGVRTAMWFVEDWQVFDYWQAYAPLYDVFAVIQKEPFQEKLAAIGQPHAPYLPLAALPEFHKPLALTPEEEREYGADIGFLGAGYPNRRLAFRPLAGRDFKIWGSDWDGESVLAPCIQRGGQRISEEESVKIYNASRINLNLHSSLKTETLVSHGDFVNPRTFELAAMGAFQLVDKRRLLPELFAGDELACFDSEAELYEKIDYFLTHPEERAQFCRRARERVLAEHTYARRMQQLLDYVAGQFGPWKAEEGQTAIAPPLLELLQRLELGPGASFENVVHMLRQQSGVLNDVETAILFLDEWRRQYRGGI